LFTDFKLIAHNAQFRAAINLFFAFLGCFRSAPMSRYVRQDEHADIARFLRATGGRAQP
jgi:hypothetical protein